jgi:hypothetical protein
MSLKPNESIMAGLAITALVYGVYSNATPTITEIRAAKPGDTDVEASRKMAAWTAGAVVAGVSLIAKDSTIFIIGGSAVIVVDWWHRHANAVDPRTGRAVAAGGGMDELPVSTQQNDSAAFSYSDDITVY